MSFPFVPQIGAVLSADIAVPEHARQVRFYSRVLSTGENPLWREDLLNNLGLPIIGLGEFNAQHSELPLQWMPHIQVADVRASVNRARDLGGRELMHAKQSDGSSQWAVLSDPNGAAFGLIPVVPKDQISPIDRSSPDASKEVGCIRWLDLTVPDARSIQHFYRRVVGWTVKEVERHDNNESHTDYIMHGEEGNPVAGIRQARGANKELPPVWILYLPVADLAESMRRVEQEGGQVVMTLNDESGNIGSAIIQDIVGVHVALVSVTRTSIL